ncbi:MAG: enoyl-CoA hydratase/isomerase family protein, partial [Gemmatimonadales bacterium]
DGGWELALGCNLIVATKSATFGLPEIGIGVFPQVAAVVLPAAGPRRKAMEWILTGSEVGAVELEHFGLVNQTFDDKTFEAELGKFVESITKRSGPVLQLAKRAQTENYYATWGEALYRVENIYLRELMALADSQEGLRAFLEKRPPEWSDS